ncbi:hypothetical protein ACWEVD_04870 [Nocardia thailandica]
MREMITRREFRETAAGQAIRDTAGRIRVRGDVARGAPISHGGAEGIASGLSTCENHARKGIGEKYPFTPTPSETLDNCEHRSADIFHMAGTPHVTLLPAEPTVPVQPHACQRNLGKLHTETTETDWFA